MTKKLVLVEVLSQFVLRYVVEADEVDHALDTIILDEDKLKEFSQKHLDPTVILSHREITKEEYLKLFDEDNNYLKSWDDEQKMSLINSVTGEITD